MLKTKKWLSLVVLLALTITACTPTPPAQPAAQPEAAQPDATATPAAEAAAAAPPDEKCAPAADGTLAGVDPSGQKVIWWHNHRGSREELLKPIVEKFNQSNDCGITVEPQSQGNYDEIRDKVNASIAAGEQPAALLVGYQNDQGFYQLNDTLVDLNTYVNDPTWGLSEAEIKDFYPSFFEQSVHVIFDNQRLGFPPNRSMEVLFYNQTWLEELGFAGPPKTPQEFKDMSCAAAKANGDGTGGFILSDDASALASWTYAFGGDILSEDRTGYVYNNQATIDAVTLLKQMFVEKCAYFFTEGFPNPEFANRRALFTQGSSSGIPFYAGDVATVATEKGKDPDVWGVAAIPYITENPRQNLYGGDVMITVTSPEQQLAAWIFVKWFTSPEIQAEWDKASGYFPTRASTAEFLKDYVNENKQWGAALELLPFGVYEPQFISYTAVRDAAKKAFNEMMQGADIKATLDALTETANQTEKELMAEAK